MKLLQTKELDIGYEAGKALQSGLNLSIEPGQTVALMGQNGVGKTTFLKTINGLIPSLSGDVLVGDRPLSNISRAELAQLCALVLTTKPMSGNLTVTELVALGRHPYSSWLGFLSKKDEEVVQHAIDLTKTNYIAHRRISELSDGQLQKVMIARALAQDTPLIILDEPVAHLDLNNKIEVMLLLREIAKQGKGVLISTHDIQVVTQLADELWLFGFQEPTKCGLPEDLIIDGTLEQMLFLSDHHYDLVHHRLNWRATGPIIRVAGDGDLVYWTSQALQRAGFQIGDSDVEVRCEESFWGLSDETFYTIAQLVQRLKETTSSLSA